MNDDKGWTMLAGDDEGATVPPANHYCRQGPLGMAVLDADAMIDRYIAARTPKGTLPLHAELRTENEHLRLALLTMAARERDTAAERDALRTMLAEARDANMELRGRMCVALIEESIACLAMTCEPNRSANGALIDISRRLSVLVRQLQSGVGQ